ncbi:F/Y-rich N-terminus-domain-containing protein [Thamnidium elegans]|nr:F/Y-rich N-terminus-domain-containing protein [Thamnidium elegans]
MVPKDENGNIVLPFQIASLNVIDLGTIDSERSQFHNERYIFPIGYTVERTYMSMVDPNNQTTYTCKVEDGQEGPLFTLSAADAPEIELSARTATGVWALVIKKANEVRQKESSNAISGPEYYGFAHPLVIEMIEEMEGVDECFRYKRRHKEL